MHTTSPSLLEKLRQSNDADAWPRFVDLYTPLLYFWARMLCPHEADADDLVQDVFVKLLQELPKLTYDPNKTFRGWLRTVCMRHWQDYQRRHAKLPGQADEEDLNRIPAADAWEQFWEQDYNALVMSQALRIIADQFDAKTQTIIKEVVMKKRPVKDLAQELGLTPNAVSSRKRRVLVKLKQELSDCLD